MTAETVLPAIEARDVTKLYRRWGRKRSVGSLKSALLSGRPGYALAPDQAVPALTNVSFLVTPGETVGVVGANGSGKSTLLKLLAGVLQPTSGTVSVRGRLAALLELGAGFHPEISGRENVLINGLLLGLTKREIAGRFDRIVRFAELEEFIDAPVKTYSSGMAVRLGFSIAAHCDPDVLLVDEVLAVGDEAFARRSLEKFSEFERAGKTLLFVSHDLGLVIERCRRALWLDGGRLAADGPSGETVARYRESVSEREAERRAGTRHAAPTVARPDRIGSGAASISGVRLLDGDGRPTSRVRSGEPARFAMDVEAPSALDDFVFGFAISTVSGAVVFGSNTEIDGFAAEELAGESTVVLEIEALDLAPGVYAVDAAVHARDGSPYDYRRDLFRFEVAADRAVAGVWNPARTWKFAGGVRWKSGSRA
ncbi:MAG TPA: ABC transporter ATP-binding protein [Thermoanaerobaculia bacterium]|nr:ABC transporter ATP-binding protein [Thermoanaerobaculia bacterium]